MMRANKNELYASLLIVLVAFLLPMGSAHPSPAQVYRGALTGAALMLFGLLCAWHAILDIERMAWPELIIAVPWFIILLIFTCYLFATLLIEHCLRGVPL